MIFEAIMLLCFAAAWPFSLWKSYVSRSNGGKSLGFLIVVEVGYVSGIIHKVFYQYDAVIYLYFLNMVFVLADMILFFRNKRLQGDSR